MPLLTYAAPRRSSPRFATSSTGGSPPPTYGDPSASLSLALRQASDRRGPRARDSCRDRREICLITLAHDHEIEVLVRRPGNDAVRVAGAVVVHRIFVMTLLLIFREAPRSAARRPAAGPFDAQPFRSPAPAGLTATMLMRTAFTCGRRGSTKPGRPQPAKWSPRPGKSLVELTT